MPQWGNTDDAANSVFWVGSLVKQGASANTRDALFNNTTEGDFIDNLTAGQFGVDTNEIAVARAEGRGERPAHAGWILRTEGTGGRAGRVQTEVLVAMSSITGDANDDAILPDATIIITTQPANVEAAPLDNATFTVAVDTVPAGANVTYLWTLSNLDPIPPASVVGEVDEPTLVIDTAVQDTPTSYVVTISAAGATSVTSGPANLTFV